MVEETANEGTPLMTSAQNLRRSFTRGLNFERPSSAQTRTVDILKRARTRLRPDTQGPDDSGIEKVCQEIEDNQQKGNRFFWVAIFFIVNHILGGAITLYFLQGWSFFDCLYFCIVTTTTVGYGDLTPTNAISKIYVIYYVIVSIGLISTMLAYLVGLLLDQQEELLLAAITNDNPGPGDSEDEEMEYDIDMMEARPPGTINQRIMDATRMLDKSDYYELSYAIVFLLAVLAIGFTVFLKLENLSIIDSLYTTIISATTVGFGDFEPTQNATKLIMTVWLCFSTIAVGKLVADFTDASVKAKQRGVSRRLLTAAMDVESLQMMDKDRDGSVDKCEFLSELLIRSGKVERKDVETILLRFEQLDKDRSGEINAGEVLQ